ncbi:MAG: hypothetical protein ACKV2T_42620 [Kofleriaceae bacterium]
MRLAFAGLLLLAACPSKSEAEKANAAMREFRDRMCACKEKACADLVQEQVTAWGTEMSVKWRDLKPSEGETKRMSEYATTYSECLTKLVMVAPPDESPVPVKGDPVPTQATPSPNLPPPSHGTLSADRLLVDARTWARAKREDRNLASAVFAYVDRHGALDPADGEVRLRFGRFDETESKRRLGAKVRPKAPRGDCFELSTANGSWREDPASCIEAAPVAIHCTVAQIWQRALDKQVPPEALATISLTINATATWAFSIDDEPREVHIRHTFPDDCPLAVEK